MTKLEFIKKMREFGWDPEYVRETIQNIEYAAKQGINVPYEMFAHEFPTRDYPNVGGSLEEWRKKEEKCYKKREKEFDELEAMYANEKNRGNM